jgi:hypothetical protein
LCHTNGPGLATGARGHECRGLNADGDLLCCLRCECISPKTGRPCRRRVCTGNVCWQHAKSHFGLRVKRVPPRTYFDRDGKPVSGLGKGLYAAVRMRKGCIIGKFQGDMLSLEQLEKIYPGDTVARYAVTTSKDGGAEYAYDVRDTSCNLVRYANDARGLHRRTRRGKLAKVQCNAKIVEPEHDGGPPLLQATRNIAAGDEIFVPYGSEYWR